MIYLKKIESLDDFEDYYCIKSDPSAVLWSGFASAPSRDNLKNYFEKLISNDDIYVYHYYDDSSQKAIGYGQFCKQSENEALYMGTSILSQHQGKGLGNLCTNLLMDMVKSKGFRRIYAWVSPSNVPSIKALEKNNFVPTNIPAKTIKLQAIEREEPYVCLCKDL